jgi:thioredoxin 1
MMQAMNEVTSKHATRWGWTAAVLAGIAALLLLPACEHRTDSAASEHNDTNIVTLTKSNFREEVLASSQPVLVDFWAVWCGPCKILAPTISELAAEYKGRVKFGKVDVDRQTTLVENYNVEGFPTVLLFKDGKVADRFLGVQEKKLLQEKLNGLLGSPASAGPKAAGQ